jgi:hypothetical protein
MLFLDAVYVEHPDGALRFSWVTAPASAELAGLAQPSYGASVASASTAEC